MITSLTLIVYFSKHIEYDIDVNMECDSWFTYLNGSTEMSNGSLRCPREVMQVLIAFETLCCRSACIESGERLGPICFQRKLAKTWCKPFVLLCYVDFEFGRGQSL